MSFLDSPGFADDVRSVLGDLLSLPQEFLNYIVQYGALNPLPIPLSQITGFSTARAAAVAAMNTPPQSINNTTVTDVTMAAAFIWSTSGATPWPARGGAAVTVAVPETGTYLVNGWVQWAQNGTGTRNLFIVAASSLANALPFGTSPGDGSIANGTAVSALFQLNANDTVKLQVEQDSGGALNCSDARMSIIRVA